MKAVIYSAIILLTWEMGYAQEGEYSLLSRFDPQTLYGSPSYKEKPAGYEILVPSFHMNGPYDYSSLNYYWTFLLSDYGTIAIQTPMLPYHGKTTILRITDTTKTVCRIVSYDSIQNSIPEYLLCCNNDGCIPPPYIKKQRNRRNMIIQNDSLTIYLINIKPQNLEKICRVVTTPIADYR